MEKSRVGTTLALSKMNDLNIQLNSENIHGPQKTRKVIVILNGGR